MPKEKPEIPEAAGRIHGILDFVEEGGVDPKTQALLDSVRDKVNALTPETRPYFSPKEEAARIDLMEFLQDRPEGMALDVQAIEHLERRTEEGVRLVREHMEKVRLNTRFNIPINEKP